MKNSIFILCAVVLTTAICHNAHSEILKVGPGMQFILPSVAAEFAQDGDVIEISAKGMYDGDVAVWKQNNITLKGVDGKPHLKANGRAAQGKGIWVIRGDNVSVENIEFSGAKVKDKNGAGIRGEGTNLTVMNCYFHDNENGILAGGNPNSHIIIENSEFSYNGAGDGKSHNLYIGKIGRLTFRYNYSHHAVIGHNLKSRAIQNVIVNNRIMDEEAGNASYAVDIPNGGIAYLIGNIIQQGQKAENWAIAAFGMEDMSRPANTMYLINNTIVNDRHSGRFISTKGSYNNIVAINNIFAGKGELPEDRNSWSANILNDEDPEFVNRVNFDYRLKAGSPAIDKANSSFLESHKPEIEIDIFPTHEYQHKASSKKREINNALDIGAFEY